MIKSYKTKVLLNQSLYFLIFILGHFILLAPISLVPVNILLPEIMLLITLVLIIRNPDYVPIWLISVSYTHLTLPTSDLV